MTSSTDTCPNNTSYIPTAVIGDIASLSAPHNLSEHIHTAIMHDLCSNILFHASRGLKKNVNIKECYPLLNFEN